MSAKKISIGTKPTISHPVKAADAWVDERKPPPGQVEKTKRLTLDIPASLHARIKSACAMRDKKMVEEITELLEAKYPSNN